MTAGYVFDPLPRAERQLLLKQRRDGDDHSHGGHDHNLNGQSLACGVRSGTAALTRALLGLRPEATGVDIEALAAAEDDAAAAQRLHADEGERLRGAVAHLGELYATSRTRQILMRDARCSDPGGAHRFTCSRDVLRSLIATQRMGLLLCKGGVSECELRAEMQRDCVDVAPFSLHNDAYVTMAQKCEQLAIAIADWGRLRGSMKATLAGGQADYACGPTFCFLRLACKPRYALNAGRVAREYIYYFFMLLFRTCSLSATDISTRTPADAPSVQKMSDEADAMPSRSARCCRTLVM